MADAVTNAAGPAIVDLSHVIEDGLITYKGLPAPIICDFLRFHRFADGIDLSELSLKVTANLPGVLVDATRVDGRAIGAGAFEDADVAGAAVLVRTGWDRNWRTDAYFEGHPFLTEAAANLLIDRGAVLVGIDSYNIDDTADMRRPVHTALLGAGIPIVEHMTGLDRLPAGGFRFSAVPPKIKGMGTFPVRAFAVIE